VSEPGPDTFPLTVHHRENLGSDLYVHGSVGDGAHRLIVRALPEEMDAASIGRTVLARRVRGEAMVFGADNRRIPFADVPERAAA
jgi:multiple sugar transport system ATP-binding protein